MSKFLPAHAAIASLVNTQAISKPSDITFARGLLAAATATWHAPEQRHVITDALGTLQETAATSKVTGKTQFVQDISDAMKTITAQPSLPPLHENGAGKPQLSAAEPRHSVQQGRG